jgi:hypothetical protein
MVKRGSWTLVLNPQSSVLGSGKVAGKVLIVDQYAEHANKLILLETVLKWCSREVGLRYSMHHLPIELQYSASLCDELYLSTHTNVSQFVLPLVFIEM